MSPRSPDQVHAALRASETLTNTILRSATDVAIIVTDRSGTITTWNSGAEAIFRWAEPNALGHSLSMIFTPEDQTADVPAQEMATADAQGRAADDRWHLRQDGTRFYALGSMVPLKGGDGSKRGYLKILRDATEARQIEEVRASAAREHGALVATQRGVDLAGGNLDAVMNAVVQGALALAPHVDGAVIEMRDGDEMVYQAAAGSSAPHVGLRLNVESSFSGLCITQGRPLICADSKTDERVDQEACRRVGIASMLAVPVPHHGRYVGVLKLHSGQANALTAADVPPAQLLVGSLAAGLSGAAEAEAVAALRRLNETLESQVEERTQALRIAEEALRQSQKLEAVGQLTGGVAHDFNNLLTIIRSSVDFLRRRDLPEERRRRYVDAVSDTVDRAAKLTGQLLAFARRQTLKPEVFEVGTCLRAVVDMLNPIMGGRVAIAIEAPSERCFVRADLSQFETALVNMAVNARDAMDGEGKLTLSLSVGQPMPAIRGHAPSLKAFAAISLTDTGTGIAPEVMSRIFEPFFTTKEVGKGTGLGLSQVFGFAKQSGGNVNVLSEVGHGTTLTLYLPQVDQVVEPEIDVGEEDAPLLRGAGRRVLVVEDNSDIGRFTTQTLQDLGYLATWVTNAAAALERLAVDPSAFDVVFSDVVMPGMNGVDLGQEIRRCYPSLPVILASGYSDVLAAEGSYGFELLHKPYSVEQLSRILRHVTRRRRASRPH